MNRVVSPQTISSMRALALLCATAMVTGGLPLSPAPGAERPDSGVPEAAPTPANDDPAKKALSPDRRFAIRESGGFDRRDCALVARRSGEVLLQIELGFIRSTHTLWSADSHSVAVALRSGSTPPTTIRVYVRRAGKFVAQSLPPLRDPTLRPRDEHDPALVHYLCDGEWDPARWKRDGSLVLIGHTAANGNGAFAHAWTILTLAPRRQGRWVSAGEIHRYSNEQSGGPTSGLRDKARARQQ